MSTLHWSLLIFAAFLAGNGSALIVTSTMFKDIGDTLKGVKREANPIITRLRSYCGRRRLRTSKPV